MRAIGRAGSQFWSSEFRANTLPLPCRRGKRTQTVRKRVKGRVGAVEPNESDLLTTEEAAMWLGISRSAFIRWSDAGRIPFKVGPDGDRRFRRVDLEAVAVRINREPEAEE